jgi:hypothetical protein
VRKGMVRVGGVHPFRPSPPLPVSSNPSTWQALRRIRVRRLISRGWWYPLLGVSAAVACNSPGVSLIDPDFTGVDRSVQVVVRLEDSSLAAALGWSEGVPGAEVSLHRVNSEFTLRTGITDASGSA